MNILIGTILLAGVAIWLWQRLPDATARQAAGTAVRQLVLFIFPRIVVALIGAALFADLLPEEVVRDTFGAQAGLTGILLSILIGPATPGGPFVCFAIVAAGLQAGASPAAAMGYVTSWTLFSFTRVFAYELPLLGRSVVLRRLWLSLPIPFAIAAIVMTLG